MIVSDVMTRDVLSVTPEDSVNDAASQLLSHRISGLLVVDAKGDLAGIITEGDLLRRGELGTEREPSWWRQVLASPSRQAADFTRAHGRKVKDVMTQTVISIAHDAALGTVVDLMEEHRIKRLPVTQDGRVVGLVSRADLLKAILARSQESVQARTDDETIRTAILAEVERQPWAPSMTLNVTVRDGMVELAGTVMGDEERRALCVLAENVRGVREVRDGLMILEPHSGTIIEAPDERP